MTRRLTTPNYSTRQRNCKAIKRIPKSIVSFTFSFIYAFKYNSKNKRQNPNIGITIGLIIFEIKLHLCNLSWLFAILKLWKKVVKNRSNI